MRSRMKKNTDCQEATRFIWFGVVFTGAIASCATLIVLSFFVAAVQHAAESISVESVEASLLSYVEDHAPKMMDEYVSERLVPQVQEQLFSNIFATMVPPLEQEEEEQQDEIMHSHNHRREVCPLEDTRQCRILRNTCSAFRSCQTRRTQETCLDFARNAQIACSQICKTDFTKEDNGELFSNACSYRLRCLFDLNACAKSERDLSNACAQISLPKNT